MWFLHNRYVLSLAPHAVTKDKINVFRPLYRLSALGCVAYVHELITNESPQKTSTIDTFVVRTLSNHNRTNAVDRDRTFDTDGDFSHAFAHPSIARFNILSGIHRSTHSFRVDSNENVAYADETIAAIRNLVLLVIFIVRARALRETDRTFRSRVQVQQILRDTKNPNARSPLALRNDQRGALYVTNQVTSLSEENKIPAIDGVSAKDFASFERSPFISLFETRNIIKVHQKDNGEKQKEIRG